MFHGDGVPVMENGPQDGLDDTMVAPEDATESLLAATEPTSHASTPGGPPPGPPAPEVMTPSAGGEGDHSEVEEEEGTQGTLSCSCVQCMLWPATFNKTSVYTSVYTALG